jgi:AcrR family transcriptional regulator
MAEIDPPRARILTAATELFGSQGYSGTSVREVVEAAGVTKPTLYYYFENKEALFREAVQLQFDGLKLLIDHVLAQPVGARERCSEFLQIFVGGGLENPKNVQLLVLANTGLERGQPRIPLVALFAEQITRLESLFTDPEVGMSPDRAYLAVVLLVGAANELLFRGLDGLMPPEAYAERVVCMLFDGVQPEKE